MYVERDVRKRFEKLRGVYNVIAVVGARQAGKTTFLKERIKGVNSSFVLFDDPDARTLFEEDVKKFEKQFVEGFDVTVLDEVQYCRDAGSKIKYLVDNGRRVWLTSSSEIVLSEKILSFLVGRVSILRLYPFSLHEFLSAKNEVESTNLSLERSVWEHVSFGGYPKVVLSGDVETKKIVLSDLYETMVLKDAAKTFSITDVRALDELARYLAVNVGCVLSFETVSKALASSFQTVKKYLDALEKSYLIARVPPFCSNKGKEISKQPKIFFVDTGLKNVVAKNFFIEPDGKTFENYVFSELVKTGFQPKYWRTKSGAEVDFVIEKNGEIIPVGVKLRAEPKKIERSLRSFIEYYKPRNALIVSYKTIESAVENVVDENGCKTRFVNTKQMFEFLQKDERQ
jgi:predicted AAA+ superfamily ATPase